MKTIIPPSLKQINTRTNYFIHKQLEDPRGHTKQRQISEAVSRKYENVCKMRTQNDSTLICTHTFFNDTAALHLRNNNVLLLPTLAADVKLNRTGLTYDVICILHTLLKTLDAEIRKHTSVCIPETNYKKAAL